MRSFFGEAHFLLTLRGLQFFADRAALLSSNRKAALVQIFALLAA